MTATRHDRSASPADDRYPLGRELCLMSDGGGPPDQSPTGRADASPENTAGCTDGTIRWLASEEVRERSVVWRGRIERLFWAAVGSGPRPPGSTRNTVHHHEDIPCR